MINFDFLEGMTLSDEEMVVVHGGISVAVTGGNHCGKDCRPAIRIESPDGKNY